MIVEFALFHNFLFKKVTGVEAYKTNLLVRTRIIYEQSLRNLFKRYAKGV